MAKIRVQKKQLVIEVEQFHYGAPEIDGVFYPENDGKFYIGDAYVVTAHEQKVFLRDGDWIFPEPDGKHFYPVKDEIFRTTYDIVEG